MTLQIHSPLNASTYQFRILRLLSGTTGTVIKCEVQIHTLIAPPKFIALSYCWGDETIRRPAVLNGIQITITESLEEALQQLRTIGVELIWVDALCINQNDIQERSLQVRLMKQIYTKAHATYAWVGGFQSDGAVRALSFLEQVSNRPEILAYTCHNHEKTHTEKHTDPTNQNDEDGSAQDRTDDCPACYLESSFEALLELFQHSYWQRRWIIQEAATAKRTYVLCGEKLLVLDNLSMALHHCKKTIFWTGKHETSYRFLARIERLRESYHNREHLGLFKVLLDTKDCLSKEKRDQIFALLGICADGDSLVPIPNYDETLESVMIGLTKELLRRNGAFEIILIDQPARRNKSLLPSWCPDWLKGDLSPEAYSVAERPLRLARSYGVSSSREDSLKLHVQGLKLGSVVAMTSILNSSITFEDTSNTSQPLQHPAQHARYYGMATATAVSACLRASTKSPQRIYLGNQSWSKTYKVQLYMLLQLTRGGASASCWSARQPHWPFLHQWLAENQTFVVGGQTLQELIKQHPISPWLWLVKLYLSSQLLFFLAWFTAVASIYSPGLMLFLSGIKSRSSDSDSLTSNIEWSKSGPGVVCCLIALLVGRQWGVIHVLLGDLRRDLTADPGVILPSARLIVLDTGAMAVTCSDVQIGDCLCFVAGCESAAVLRRASPTSEEETHSVVGRAFACLSSTDSERYKAFCELSPVQKNPYVYDECDGTDEYNDFIEVYKNYKEWKHFVLV